jgi:hypothetical protein
VSLDYDQKLPLLRVLVARQIFIDYIPIPLNDIIQKYAGQGRKGSLACAAEMARAGYKENARW